jgi:hypothetical protein
MPSTVVSGSVDDQEGEVRQAAEISDLLPPFLEVGATGLKRSAGFLDEEFLPQLKGRKAVQVFKEMSENDPLVGSLLFTIRMLLRNVKWTVEPNGKSRAHKQLAELLETSMDDMEHTWDEFITEVLTMLTFGWSWHEIVYKRRNGPWTDDPRQRSQHNDGLISWRKMPIRAQETLFKWVFDDSGDLKALVQMPPPSYKQVMIPHDRSLLFRFVHYKGNPEGVSLLRNAYRPWYMKKRIEEFEAVGVERDLAGLPMVKVPAEWLKAPAGSQQRKAVDGFKKMVRSIRRDEQEGLVFPVQYDQDTKQPLFDFQLLGSGGGRQFQTDQIIQRYEQRILMSVLADFIMVGHQSTGSYSMHVDKTGIFRTALNSINDSIAQVLNRYAVPRLARLNGFKVDDLPKFVPMDVDAPDLQQLAGFMQSMQQMGLKWFPDPDMEKFVRAVARLPEMDDQEEQIEAQRSERSQAAEFLATQAELATAQQRLAAAQAPPVQQPGQPGQPGAVGTAQPPDQPPTGGA